MSRFTAQDQQQLVWLYQLDREQLRDNSVLRRILEDAERFDDNENQDTVAQVQELLSQIYGPNGWSEQYRCIQTNPYRSRPDYLYDTSAVRPHVIRGYIHGAKNQITRLLESTSKHGYGYSYSYGHRRSPWSVLSKASVHRAMRG